MKYVQIIILKKAGEFDDPLTYSVPKELEKVMSIGLGVHVPLRNRLVPGVVVDINTTLSSSIEPAKVKPVKDITEFKLDKRQIDLAKTISSYYRTSLTRSLRLMIPSSIWKGKLDKPKNIYYKLVEKEAEVRGTKQKEVIDTLISGEEISALDINASKSTLNSLIEKGIVEEVSKPTYTELDYKKIPLKPLHHKLTDKQEHALSKIKSSKKPVLLHGITGSGKTELYLRVALEAIKKGKQAILLVPEIALTPQMIDYFKDYFGPHLALFHSRLSDGERAKEWWKVRSGYSALVVGSRSAIFAPVKDLGVVILDEEHEWTYKQESAPYYQTHHVGEIMSEIWDTKLILGSATPRLESIYKTKTGEYEYIHIAERINKKELPDIQVIDLRDEFKQKNFSVLSRRLKNKMEERLEKKEQVILFVNQRGVASAVVCRDCGHTEECPNCEVSLKFHRGFGNKQDALVCHYCGYAASPKLTCPECNSPHIKHVGVGTQRVEEEVNRIFPNARVVRADKDTTSTKDGFEPIYKAFKKGEYDVLVGTQMVAKGLDFNNVTLIGIILADIGLHVPDFRSHERLFQIITQVAGRCGRGEGTGEVVLQTYQPDHFAIKKAAEYDFDSFSEKELSFREKLKYPPYNNIIKFTVVGGNPNELRENIEIEKKNMENIFKVNNLTFKIVSAPAMIPKIANQYHYHVLIRSKDPHVIFDYWKPPKYWRIDVDPIHTA